MLFLPPQALASAGGGCIPSFSMKLDAAVQHARVTGGVAEVVVFTGQMGLTKLPAERCVVTLNASTDTGWAAQVSPPVTVFTSTTPQPFSCSVSVPAGASANQTARLAIKGRVHSYNWQGNAEVNGHVIVDPYFRISLSTDKPITTIVQGERTGFAITATNLGNGNDSFTTEISNLGELRRSGWTVVLDGTLRGIRPGENRTLRLAARSPGDDRAIVDRLVHMKFRCESQNATDQKEDVSQTISLTIQVRSVWLPNLCPYLLILFLAIAAGYLLRPRYGLRRRAPR